MIFEMYTGISSADAFIFVFVFSIVFLWFRQRRPSKYPPGPTPLPIIGNLHHLSGADILEAFRNLRKQYGDLYSLSLGKYWVVVVNGREHLKELFVRRSDVTSDRPDSYLLTVQPYDAITTGNGEPWKYHRKFAISKLKEFGFGKYRFESKIIQEMEIFLKTIKDYNSQSFRLENSINVSFSNIVLSILVGRRFDYDDPKFVQFVKYQEEIIRDPIFNSIVNFFPALARIPGDPFRAHPIREKLQRTFDFFRNEIEEHRDTLDEDDVRDFIDTYLNELKQEKYQKGIFSVEHLTAALFDMWAAATDTTATVIHWALLHLIRNPTIQQKMYTEINDVVGNNRVPSINDKQGLPYCEAVMLEALRISNVTPLGLPHSASDDIYYNGYIIPKNAILIPCLESVAYDESVFPDSLDFKPERFLDKENKVFGQDRLLTFSLGKRMCLGESLARLELFLYLTTLVQRFEFLPGEGEDKPPVEGIFGINYCPVPFKMRAVPR